MDSKPEQFLTSEKKNVVVDAFVKWRIRPENFYGRLKVMRMKLCRLSGVITKSDW